MLCGALLPPNTCKLWIAHTTDTLPKLSAVFQTVYSTFQTQELCCSRTSLENCAATFALQTALTMLAEWQFCAEPVALLPPS